MKPIPLPSSENTMTPTHISPTTLDTHKACTDPNLYPNDTGFRRFVDWTRECDVPDQASPKQCSSNTDPERLYRGAADNAVDNDVECAVDAVKNTTRGVSSQVISLPLLTHLLTSIRHGKIRVNYDTRIMRKSPNERVRHAYMNM
ncbi:hypothetical protein BOTCAL_0136g00020 [Botryotinia calthae]|uniref:Uncharacterized protein n=1 Tax=Botryotinia calthae TaxID=38488 RepID=A0A4Y8D3L8_9HELO|nr:hypothetical protein BOTCAL_0136g00020 [Botryotinia calthae]